MTERKELFRIQTANRVGILTREFHARILNYSPSGCLIETNARIDAGTIGTLRFVIDGGEFVDDVQVVRCLPIEGAGSLYHVGARFLWTVAPGRGTLRAALREATGQLDRTEETIV